MRLPSRAAWFVGSILVTVLLALAWQFVADHRLVSPVFLPGPDRAWASLRAGLASGVMTGQLISTLRRMLYGWLLASLLGVVLGALIGSSRAAREWLGPTLEFLRPLPASAVMPVAIAFMGLTDRMILCVIVFGTVWPMLLATYQGVAATEPRLLEVSRMLRLGRAEQIWKITLPNALPDILAGMRLALTVALILAVVGEILTGQNGLGQRILLAARSFRSADLFSGVIVLSALGTVSSLLLAIASERLLRWQQR